MRLIISILVLLLFVGCSKEKKTNKRLSGTWKPVSLRVTKQSTGLTYPADATGTMIFNEDANKSTTGTYEIVVNYSFKDNDYQLKESGSYIIKSDQCFLTSHDNIETPARIIYINKSDLEFGIEKLGTDRLLFVLKKD